MYKGFFYTKHKHTMNLGKSNQQSNFIVCRNVILDRNSIFKAKVITNDNTRAKV